MFLVSDLPDRWERDIKVLWVEDEGYAEGRLGNIKGITDMGIEESGRTRRRQIKILEIGWRYNNDLC